MNSSNSEGEDNADGNGSIPDDDYANDDEDDEEDSENLSDRSQSPEESVKDDTDNTSKVDILRKKVNSPKSIASRIKEYSKKLEKKESSTAFLVHYPIMTLLDRRQNRT